MSTIADADPAADLQRDAERLRALTPDELSALPVAVQDAVLHLLARANRERCDRSAPPHRGPRLDWRGHAPSGPFAPGPDPEVLDAIAAGEPVARKVLVDQETDEWTVLELTVRRQAADGSLPRFPTASEYRAWSDERIAALRLDPEEWIATVTESDGVDLADLDDGTLRDIEGMDAPMDEQHPFNSAIERLELIQADANRADYRRVAGALHAWRVAVESAVGSVDAAVNSLFKAAVMVQIARTLQVADRTATTLVNTAEDLQRDLPLTWAAFRGGRIPWRGMQTAHAQAEGLDPQHLPVYDAKAARILTTGVLPDAKQRLHEARERLQASTAVDRHERALAGQRVLLENLPDGMAALTNVMPAAEAILAREALREQAVAAAALPGETRPIGLLESLLLTDWLIQGARTAAPDDVPGLAVPARTAALCKVGLLIPAMTCLGASEAPAILQGYGPIDVETAKRLAGAASSWVKVLTDPVTGAVKDIGRKRYKPTADMRALLGILDRGGRSPNGTKRGRIEVDHVTPFRQHLARGRTAIDNLVQLAGRAHDMKTAGYLDIELQPGNRTLVWTDFAGNRATVPLDPLEPTPVPEQYLPHDPDDPPPPF